jgi:hypothetical protein
MNAYTYNPNIFRHCAGSDWKRWRSLYKFVNYGVTILDRTGKIKTPIKTELFDQLGMPSYQEDFSLSYKQCCENRVLELVQKQDSLGVPITLMYSGGIDSSMILASFIHVLGVEKTADRVKICMSREGIYENPWAWEKYIRPHFSVLSSEKYDSMLNRTSIVVAGEGNDQLLGTDIYKNIIQWGGSHYLNLPATVTTITDYLRFKNLTEEEIDLWYSLIQSTVDAAVCPIVTVGDWWWWLNFNCKWSNVYWRMLVYADPSTIDKDYLCNYYQQFFNTVDFQRWSMKDRTHKIVDSYVTYKYHARELIADMLNIPEYLFKTKKGSLYDLTRSKKSSDVIDADLQFHYGTAPMTWHNPDNSFI